MRSRFRYSLSRDSLSCRLRDPSPVPFRQNGIAFRDRGTEGSNPARSSGESTANSTADDVIVIGH